MTLDEAIKHAREIASQGCTECNKNHEQLAEWLEELKATRKALELLSIQYSYFFHHGKDCPFEDEEWRTLPWCEEIMHDLDCSRECIKRYYLMKAREEG